MLDCSFISHSFPIILDGTGMILLYVSIQIGTYFTVRKYTNKAQKALENVISRAKKLGVAGTSSDNAPPAPSRPF